MLGLAEKAASVSRPRVGRSSVEKQGGKTQPIPVRIGPELRARIDAARDGKPVADFIREAVEEKLAREKP